MDCNCCSNLHKVPKLISHHVLPFLHPATKELHYIHQGCRKCQKLAPITREREVHSPESQQRFFESISQKIEAPPVFPFKVISMDWFRSVRQIFSCYLICENRQIFWDGYPIHFSVPDRFGMRDHPTGVFRPITTQLHQTSYGVNYRDEGKSEYDNKLETLCSSKLVSVQCFHDRLFFVDSEHTLFEISPRINNYPLISSYPFPAEWLQDGVSVIDIVSSHEGPIKTHTIAYLSNGTILGLGCVPYTGQYPLRSDGWRWIYEIGNAPITKFYCLSDRHLVLNSEGDVYSCGHYGFNSSLRRRAGQDDLSWKFPVKKLEIYKIPESVGWGRGSIPSFFSGSIDSIKTKTADIESQPIEKVSNIFAFSHWSLIVLQNGNILLTDINQTEGFQCHCIPSFLADAGSNVNLTRYSCGLNLVDFFNGCIIHHASIEGIIYSKSDDISEDKTLHFMDFSKHLVDQFPCPSSCLVCRSRN